MSDTHDERGGDEAAVCSTSCDPDCDAVCHEDHVPGRKKRHWPYDCPAANEYFWDGDQFTADAIKRLRGERDEAREQLAAATAELGRVNRRADFLDDALDGMRQQAIEAVVARNAATARAEKAKARVAGFGPACCVCGRIVGYRNYRNQLFCWPCADGEPKTTDAAQDGLSEPVERSETSGGAFHGNTSSSASAGLSEPEPPRDTSAWCWAPNPHTLLHCGRLRDHEPPHRRGERTWTDDDTTEDGRHG